MRILIANYEFPPLGGGGGRASSWIARELVAMGHQVGVLTVGHKLQQTEYTVEQGVRIWRLAAYRPHLDRTGFREKGSFVWHARRFLPELVAELQPQAAILFFAFPTAAIGPMLTTRFSVPYVVSFRGGDVPGLERGIRWLHTLLAPLRRRILSKARAVTANSGSLATSLQPYTRHLVQVIGNGVDSQFFLPLKRPLTPFKALWVGRIQAQKNIPFLLEAWRLSQLSDAELVLAGDGPDRPKVERYLHDLGLSNTRITGWLSRDELLAHYQSAHVLLNTSFYEGHSNTALEGMSTGLPVFASDVPGNRDLVVEGESGFVIPLALKAWSQQLIWARDHRSELESMGQCARDRVVSDFSWIQAARAYAELLEAVAN